MPQSTSFTKATLAAVPLPDAGKRTYIHDPRTRGLALAVTDKGTRSYVFYRKIKGRPQRVLLGRFDELSIEQARNKAAALNGRVAEGWDPRVDRLASRNAPTLAQLFDDFINRHGKVNIKSSDKYVALFKRYFCTAAHGGLNLGQHVAKEVTRSDIARVFGNITSKGQPVVANRALATVASMFGWAVRAGLVENNPARGIRKNSERGRARDRFLRPSEMPHFFQSVAAHGNDAMRDYVLLSLLTGQRQANVLAMEWNEIDFSARLWRIPRTKTKTAREYLVPLTPDAIDILEARRVNSNGKSFVLPGTGATGHFNEPKSSWKRLLLRAEGYALIAAVSGAANWTADVIEETKQSMEVAMSRQVAALRQHAITLQLDVSGISFSDLWMHDLRRTLASWQATTGANLVAISKTLNHSNVSTTSIYARLQTDPVRHAIQVATDAMMVAAGVRKSAAVTELKAA